MEIYLRSRRAWASLGVFPVLGYDVPLASSDVADTGTVSLPSVPEDLSGQWAVLGGRVYQIKRAAAKSGQTQLTLALPETVFARRLRYTGDGEETYGDFLAGVIAAEWISQTDPEYALPYLTVSNLDHTAFAMPAEAGSLYDLQTVFSAALAAGVRFAWAVGYSTITLQILPPESAAHVVLTASGDSALLSATESASLVAKVTVLTVDKDTRELLASADYYWQPSGGVLPDPPTPRIEGTWTTVEISADGDPAAAALAACAKNDASYKIELASVRTFALGDALAIRHRDRVYRGQVTRISQKSGDRRTFYRLGSLPVTLTEKVASLGAGGATTVITASGGGGGGGGVTSVNGKTGAVSLTASDVGALPDSTAIPAAGTAAPANLAAAAAVGSSARYAREDHVHKRPTAAEIGALPSTYTPPVTSVNSKTGAVSLTASDVGALPDSTAIPAAGTAAPANLAAAAAVGSSAKYAREDHVHKRPTAAEIGALPSTYTPPVTSVNSKTGAVSLTASDVGALPDSTAIPAAGTAAPANLAAAAAVGSSAKYAREDHVHKRPTAAEIGALGTSGGTFTGILRGGAFESGGVGMDADGLYEESYQDYYIEPRTDGEAPDAHFHTVNGSPVLPAGGNLVPRTNGFAGWTFWTASGDATCAVSGREVAITTPDTQAATFAVTGGAFTPKLSTTYTLSFYAKAVGSAKGCSFSAHTEDWTDQFDRSVSALTSDWALYSITVTTPSSWNGSAPWTVEIQSWGASSGSATVSFKDLQIKEGDAVTPWSPAWTDVPVIKTGTAVPTTADLAEGELYLQIL